MSQQTAATIGALLFVTEAMGSGFETVFRKKFDTDEQWARVRTLLFLAVPLSTSISQARALSGTASVPCGRGEAIAWRKAFTTRVR